MANKWISLIRTRSFYMNVLWILSAFLVLVFIAFFILRIYTRHGEKILIPDLKDKSIQSAQTIAGQSGFTLAVNDSIFIVDKPGGVIVNQNPLPSSFAKTGRTIYVTITKYAADKIDVASLPSMYGKSFELKNKILKEAFELNSVVVGHLFDPGEEGSILKVVYGTDTIIDANGVRSGYQLPKGATLKFILSTHAGGKVQIPDLVCQSIESAQFIASSSGVQLFISGDIQKGYVMSQDPPFVQGEQIEKGEIIKVNLSEEKPANCPDATEIPEDH